ncbi:uncharacterized protein LOC126744169 [Anthonomus grandis grandis]|uniref:uncharacterized protein LOC126744169 n=1 Tax=Anthonomus grandis grandis TaxID=2921223 RepID=UPI0021652CA3|nr:uncharacterized protein LOC126744169 [Anthonomus grandis grandis]
MRTKLQKFLFHSRYTCFSEKAARTIERSMNSDIPLFSGITLTRNNEHVSHRQARLLGVDRLTEALKNFLQTHVVSIDLSSAKNLGMARGGGGGGGFGGMGGKMGKQAMMREGKYMQYAFMVLLGIFGLTGPLVMKVLGLMAAKALLAAKAALIIVGSVALKKLFEKDYQEPSIKVHTVTHDDDEHDRLSKIIELTGYGSDSKGSHYSNYPYSGYYNNYYSGKNNNVR